MNINEFFKGWFIGNFEPALLNTDDFEVAVKYYNAGDYENKHVHKIATEYNVVVTGEVEMNGTTYKQGDIIVQKPGDPTDFRAITESSMVVVKVPCVKGDKYPV